MNKIKYLENYFNEIRQLIKFDKNKIDDLIKTSEILIQANCLKKKTLIFGNGGSAAIASHFSIDLTKNARIRCTNYNESDLLTCFSNDFGYERWVEKTIEFYADKEDALIKKFYSDQSTTQSNNDNNQNLNPDKNVIESEENKNS